MSIKTWKEQYYPVSAISVAQDGKLAVLQHSLRKWEGLRALALVDHGVHKSVGVISDDVESVEVDSTTCALCHRYEGCEGCPLVEVNDGSSCDGNYLVEPPDSHDRQGINAYSAFTQLSNPEPMIDLIERAIKEASK